MDQNKILNSDREVLADSILQYARDLFPVVGVTFLPNRKDSILICGLEQTQETDLDDFSIEFLPRERHRPGKPTFRYMLDGFFRFMQPRLEKLSQYIEKLGFASEILGTYGYTDASIPLKQLAVSAGLGRQGKHTVLLHPEYGPWLRFAALETSAPLTQTGSGSYLKEENPLCENCEACLRECPVEGLLSPYRLESPNKCLASFHATEHLDIHEGKVRSFCMRCLEVCPIAGGKDRRP